MFNLFCVRDKIETAAVVQSNQNLHQMQSQQNNTCCIPRGRFCA